MKKLLKSKMLYLTIGIVVVVIAVNGFFSRIRDYNSNIEQYTTGYNIEVKETKDVYNDIETGKFVTEEVMVDEIIEKNNDTPVIEKAAETSVTTISIALPLEGKLVTEHSGEELIYNKTMEDWRTHHGIDISAEIGTAVKAAADGKVIKVGYDGMNGFSIEIEHDGYITKYCGLQESDILSENKEVKKGEVIGGVGMTMDSEGAETPHLHFEMIIDNESINPLQYVENNIL